METVRCHSIARHDVALTFSEPSCRDVRLPVLWPENFALLSRCSSVSSVAVRVVGNTGNRGPWSSEFLLHSDLSLGEQVITSYPRLLTSQTASATASHAITSQLSQVTGSVTSHISQVTYPVHFSSSQDLPTTVGQTVEEAMQNLSTSRIAVEQTVEQMTQNLSTSGITVRQTVKQVTQKQSMTHTTTNGNGSVISELLNDVCRIDILKRNEHSLMVKLSAVNHQVSFERCCLVSHLNVLISFCDSVLFTCPICQAKPFHS